MEVSNMMFALLRSEINGTKLCADVQQSIDSAILPALFKLSKKHDLAHLVGDALEKNGLLPNESEAKKRFLQERNIAVYRYEQQQYELTQIFEVLKNVNIDFVPLKGSVIRDYYPEPWMRTSCDIDILVKEADLEQAVKTLVRELNYKADERKDYHDISLFSESGVHLELHYSLCENMNSIDKVLSKAWDYVRPHEGGACKKFKDSFFAFHITAHMLYHFQRGGCGVRPLLDVWLMKQHIAFDKEFDNLLKQCNINTFYREMSALSNYWFNEGAQPTAKTRKIEEYLLKAGVYGTRENHELADTVKSGSKFTRIMRYIFLPYNNMVIIYPVLKKRKILLPFFHVWRWITRIFRIKSAVKHTGTIVNQDRTELQEMQDLFTMLDI